MNSRNFLRYSKCGLGLISINDEPIRVITPNVIKSSSLVLLNDIKPMVMTPTPTLPPPSSSPPPLPPPPSPPYKKKDRGGIGFIDEMGGRVDGLMSCTESLGFESCDERRVDDDDNDDHDANEHHHRRHQHRVEFCEVERDRLRKEKSEKKILLERNKKFPPPLSSLNQNGQPCFYLKSVRKNGRLELTEVKIQQRPEILRALRENGRLRLHLVSCNHNQEQQQDLDFQEEEEEEAAAEETEDEELWKFEEGFRRCQEHVMNHHHINDHHSLLFHQDHHHHHMNKHHSLHGWRQPCVTTR